jgi:hypothetical protein
MVVRRPTTKKRSLFARLFARKQSTKKSTGNNNAVHVKRINARLPPTDNNAFVEVTHNNAKHPQLVISELKDKIAEMQADYAALETRYNQCVTKDGNSARRRLTQKGYNTANPENLTRWVRAQTPLTEKQKSLIRKGFNPKSNAGLAEFLEYQRLSSGKRGSKSKKSMKRMANVDPAILPNIENLAGK